VPGLNLNHGTVYPDRIIMVPVSHSRLRTGYHEINREHFLTNPFKFTGVTIQKIRLFMCNIFMGGA
jgi:hypothetical protein